jgi:hypothetical protein
LRETYKPRWAAAAVAFCHPGLSGFTIQKRPAEMSDAEIAGLIEQAKEDLQHGIGGQSPWPRRMH